MNLLLGLALAAAVSPAPKPAPSPSPTPSAPPAVVAQSAPAPPPSQVQPPPAASVEDLYRSILPAPIGDPALAPEAGGQAPGAATAPGDDTARDGLYLGNVRIAPSVHLVYVDAEGALETAAPVEDQYYELRPQLAADMPVSTGYVRGSYQASIRGGSSYDIVDSTTTHLADLSLELPLGSATEIVASEHYATGVLETAEVDPGREYFFRLGRYTRHRHSLGVRILPGGRADVTVGGSLDSVRVDDQAAFFDHEQQSLSAQLGYDVTPALRAALGYGYTHIPFTAERPEVESDLHSVFGTLRGEILPLTTGSLSVGYTTHTSPNAGPGGNRFTGVTASGQLEKSFTPSTSLTLTGTRATRVSAFEQNAFFVTSSVDLLLRAGLPWSLALQSGVGYHRNDYRTVASAIGVPRRDEIRGWTVGLGRPVTRHAFLRADYRRERRDSNIDGFDSRSNALTVQLGVGLFAARAR